MIEWQELTKEEKNDLIKLVCVNNMSLSKLIDLINHILKEKNHVS